MEVLSITDINIDKLSPMMKQYLKIKEKYKDCILFFRLGDFYEMFFDDAVKASKELDLVLTGRDCGLEKRAAMCGIPYHSADTYINKLKNLGFKIAIAEQTTLPDKSTAIVERDVVQVVTSGTVINNDFLEEACNNYIVCVFRSDDKIGLAWSDLSTGEFCIDEINNSQKLLSDTLARIKPVEIICNEDILIDSYELQCVKLEIVPNFSVYYSDAFEYSYADSLFSKQFGAGQEDKKNAVCAAGALLQYISETQKKSADNISRAGVFQKQQFMELDLNTRKHLELTNSLNDRKSKKATMLWLVDKTVTAMGKRTLRKWIEQPLFDFELINGRLDAVEEFNKNSNLRKDFQAALSLVKDIERLSTKISFGNIHPKDFIAIKSSLLSLPEIKRLLSKLKSKIAIDIYNGFDLMQPLAELLDKSIMDNAVLLKDGDVIKPGFSPKLDNLKKVKMDANNILALMEQSEREQTGIKNLKISYNKVFGYYIELTKSVADQAPFRYIRKQTLSNCERFITPELKELEDKLLNCEEQSQKLESELFLSVIEGSKKYVPSLQKLSQEIGVLDSVLSLAQISNDNNYVRPTINKDKNIKIIGGRHPIIEALIKESFVPNDTLLDVDENRTMIITGPNMAGKSTYMRQVALIVYMAHLGSFVPAKTADICLTDKIFTRIGASDDLAFGHSTFMVEMLEVANIIQNATPDSLLILDELGRGTSTYDGLSIAWSVMEYLSEKLKAKTLFATHFHELTELEGKLEGVKNYRILVYEKNDCVIFRHQIARGGANKSFGIEVAKLAGLPQSVVERARELNKLLQESDINKVKFEKHQSAQIALFDAGLNKLTNEIIDILKLTDINQTTPLKALDILIDLKERAEK